MQILKKRIDDWVLRCDFNFQQVISARATFMIVGPIRVRMKGPVLNTQMVPMDSVVNVPTITLDLYVKYSIMDVYRIHVLI